MTNTQPLPTSDWLEDLRRYTSDGARRPVAWSIAKGIGTGAAPVWEGMTDLASSASVASAVGPLLDRRGSQVGETRGGLGDREYRLIIAGREAARAYQGDVDAEWGLWLAVTGARDDDASIRRYGATGGIAFNAQVAEPPTAAYLIRARRVLLDALGRRPLSATLTLTRSLRWAPSLPGWPSGHWPFVVV